MASFKAVENRTPFEHPRNHRVAAVGLRPQSKRRLVSEEMFRNTRTFRVLGDNTTNSSSIFLKRGDGRCIVVGHQPPIADHVGAQDSGELVLGVGHEITTLFQILF